MGIQTFVLQLVWLYAFALSGHNKSFAPPAVSAAKCCRFKTQFKFSNTYMTIFLQLSLKLFGFFFKVGKTEIFLILILK